MGPAGDPGWRRRGPVLSWRSPRGASPRWKFRLDGRRSTFALSARGLDFDSPAGNPVLVGLGDGLDEGTDVRLWKAAAHPPAGVVAAFGIR
jgi:hypothetical protein